MAGHQARAEEFARKQNEKRLSISSGYTSTSENRSSPLWSAALLFPPNRPNPTRDGVCLSIAEDLSEAGASIKEGRAREQDREAKTLTVPKPKKNKIKKASKTPAKSTRWRSSGKDEKKVVEEGGEEENASRDQPLPEVGQHLQDS